MPDSGRTAPGRGRCRKSWKKRGPGRVATSTPARRHARTSLWFFTLPARSSELKPYWLRTATASSTRKPVAAARCTSSTSAESRNSLVVRFSEWPYASRCPPTKPELFASLLLRTPVRSDLGVVRANVILNVSSNTPPVTFTLLLDLEPYERPRYEPSRIIRAERAAATKRLLFTLLDAAAAAWGLTSSGGYGRCKD